ncbi:MAG: SMC family ATPase, partial [Caldilineaceae bacterium]|nr:SMC family ATPase [Caldilineaceae bacterium]
QIAEMERTLAQTMEQLAQIGAERAQLEAVQQQIADLQNQQRQIEQRQESVAQRKQQATAALAAAEQASVQVKQHWAGYETYLEMQKRHAALDQKQRQQQQIAAEKNGAEKQLTRLQAEETALQKSLAEIEAAESKVKQLTSAVARQSELEAQFTVTQRQALRLQEIERTQQEQQKQLAQLTKRHGALNAQLAQAEGLTKQRTAADAAVNQLREAIEAAQQDLARFKVEADAMKEQNEALTAVETAQCPVCEQPLTAAHRTEMLTRNEQRLQALRAEYGQARQNISQHESQEKAARAQIKQVDDQLRRLPRPEEIDALQAEIEQRGQTLALLTEEQAQLAQAETQLQGVEAALADLGNPRQQSAVAADMAERRPRVEAEADALKAQMAASQKTITDIQGRLAAFGTVEADLAQTTQRLQELQPAYQAVLSNRQLADTTATHQATLVQLEQEQSTLSTQQKGLETELAQQRTHFDGERLASIISRMEALRGQEVATKTQLAFSQQEQAREQAEIARLAQQKEQVERIQKEQAALQHKSDVLDAMRSVLRQAGPYITRALIQQVSSSAAHFFGDMMQDYSRHLAWNDDYGITLSVDGHDRQFNQLSGGEQMSAALSVRLALLREMSNIALAFFDEPTMNLDEGRRESLARQITDIRGFRQLFVISHDDTFEQATQNIVRVERKNGLSVAHSAS